MSETPRVDAAAERGSDLGMANDWAAGIWTLARTLERELAAVTRERDEAREMLAKFRGLVEAQTVLKEVMERREDRDVERDALRAKFERLRSVIPSLIVVQRMPNAEHVADAHNDAVRVLRAALREPTP